MEGLSQEVESRDSAMTPWKCCGAEYPRREIVFFAQVAAIYAVLVASVYNLTVGVERSDRELWIALLSSALGYMLPNPALGPRRAAPTIAAPP